MNNCNCMTSSVKTNPFAVVDEAIPPFIKSYSKLYSEGKKLFSKGGLTSVTLHSIQKRFEYLTAKLTTTPQEECGRIYEQLLIERSRCKLFCAAVKDYNATNKDDLESIFGRVAFFIKSILQTLFDYPNAQEEEKKAENLLAHFDNQLKHVSFDNKQEMVELSQKLCMMFARYQGSIDQEAELWNIDSNASGLKKTRTLIINKKGDCYYQGREIGNGTNKDVYAGEYFPFNIKKNSSTHQIAIAQFKGENAAKSLQKEIKPLEQVTGINGIIKVEDSFLAKTDDGVQVPMMITKKYDSNLHSCLQRTKLLEKPVPFMKELTNVVCELHKMGKIHRDIKELNILVDATNGTPKPILIDLEYCIDANDIGRKKGTAGSPKYLAPEYATAYLHGNTADLVKATTKAIDIWALGLVLFRTYYGEDFFNKVSKTKFESGLQIAYFVKAITQEQIDRAFPKGNDPVAEIIKNMLKVNPADRILPSNSDWEIEATEDDLS